eukprot:7930752-Pyramimonas_sp.AAC.1
MGCPAVSPSGASARFSSPSLSSGRGSTDPSWRPPRLPSPRSPSPPRLGSTRSVRIRSANIP